MWASCNEQRLYSQLCPVTSLTFSPSERHRQRESKKTLSRTETAAELYIATANGQYFERNEDESLM